MLENRVHVCASHIDITLCLDLKIDWPNKWRTRTNRVECKSVANKIEYQNNQV